MDKKLEVCLSTRIYDEDPDFSYLLRFASFCPYYISVKRLSCTQINILYLNRKICMHVFSVGSKSYLMQSGYRENIYVIFYSWDINMRKKLPYWYERYLENI